MPSIAHLEFVNEGVWSAISLAWLLALGLLGSMTLGVWIGRVPSRLRDRRRRHQREAEEGGPDA